MSAGERSGDQLGAAVAAALRRRVPDVEIDGIGGSAMRSAGVRLLHDLTGLSVVGLVEALAGLPRHVRLLRAARDRLRAHSYDLVLPIDYPGFNLQLAGTARRGGCPVLYYVAPQLWAWGAWRAPRLRASVTRLAAVLPFERQFFEPLGIPTDFVGHPLLDAAAGPMRLDARRALGVDDDRPVLGLFPGSRAHERRRLWPVMRGAALRLRQEHPTLTPAVAAPELRTPELEALGFVFSPDAPCVVRAADAGICKSGSTTLEAALAGMPMAIVYRTHAVTAAVARRVLQVPHVGLVNLVAGRSVVPELLQDRLSVPLLVATVSPLLARDSAEARAQRAAFADLRAALGTPGASARVADLALDLAA